MKYAWAALLSLLVASGCAGPSKSTAGSGGNATGGTGAGGTSSGGTSSGGTSSGGTSSGGTSSGGTSSGGTGSGGTGQSGGSAGLGACPTFADGLDAGKLESPLLLEASGVAASRKNPDVLWLHNDSGDAPRIFAARTDGKHLGVVTLAGAKAVDWEDIAVGPGPDAKTSYIYVGDIGDNKEVRSDIRVYRIAEPSVDASASAKDQTATGVEEIVLSYPDGAHNAETLMVDPLSADLFIVTKAGSGASKVFRAPGPIAMGASIVLTQVADLAFGSGALSGSPLTTAGDIAPNGDRIAIRTYSDVFVWRRPKGATVATALATDPCPSPHHAEPQGEALGFTADGSGYFTTSERAGSTEPQPLWLFAQN